MYKALFMAFDGSKVSEGNFETIAEAWDYINDCGSRWYFFPFCFVATEKTIAAAFDGGERFERKHIKTVQKIFAAESEKVDYDCGVDEFVYILQMA
jgi:hypothetical protein